MTNATTTAPGMYAAKTASRIARVRPQSFQAWIKANLLRPHKANIGDRIENTYTYDDLLLIRLIVRLKEEGATTKSIRVALDTIEYIAGGDRNAWKRARLLVRDGFVMAVLPGSHLPEWNPVAASEGPQKIAEVFFPDLIEELRDELVPGEKYKHIDIDPEILGGSPIVKGTRISTRAVMSVLESGGDPRDAYPSLTDEQITEVRDYEISYLQAA